MDYQRIPATTIESLHNYVTKGWEPGGFVTAVLCNDLSGAVGQADHLNLPALPAIVGYVYNELPSPCWGSREKFEAWMKAARVREADAESARLDAIDESSS